MRHTIATLGVLFVVVMMGITSHVASQQRTPSAPASATVAVLPQDDSVVAPEVTDERPMSFWMEKKLDYSKSILESLTKGEFAALAKEADQMRSLGKIEGFVRRKNESYRTQLRTFDFASQELVRQAKRNNAEGAALAFNQLTNSCVACHVMLREGIE